MKAAPGKSRPRFENILFATDFSSAAARAIPYVEAFALRYASNVVALHVRPPVVNPMTQPANWPEDIEAAKVADEQNRSELHRAFHEIKPQVLIEAGDFRAILDTAIQKSNIDLIVIGTRGRTGLGKFLLGSVAEQIFRTVDCPVLTVGPHSGSPSGELHEILYATGFDHDSPIAAYAVSLAREFRARLALLHVVPEAKAGDPESWRTLAASCKEILHKIVPPDTEGCTNVVYFVERGDPAQHILQLASLKEAGLIILGVQPEKAVPGAATHLPFAIAHKVASKAKCPVLTMRSD